MRNIIFIAAGGRGRRLWGTLPDLKEKKLPKSLGIVIRGRPLIAYQLDQLVPLGYTIVLSFDKQESIEVFKQHVSKGNIPAYDYLYNSDIYSPQNTNVDVIQSSYPHKPWDMSFDYIIVTSGDMYYDTDYLLRAIALQQYHRCNVQTLREFTPHMSMSQRHFHPLYDKEQRLQEIQENDVIPREVLSRPHFFTEKAFRIYTHMQPGTSSVAFIQRAKDQGETFRVLKPTQYININFPEDYQKLLSILG